MSEARRYYTNIVGKYGAQAALLLKKASSLDIGMICPLHGFVWRENLSDIISKYMLWSAYEPEEQGVMIAYASVYGNTENAAEILSHKLRDSGVKTVMFDVSVTPASEIVAAAFRFSHLVFASTTYNAGIFVSMEALINDLVAHNIQNRKVALIENGSWAATSGSLMREKLSKCKNMDIMESVVSLRSGLKEEQLADITAMAEALKASLGQSESAGAPKRAGAGEVDAKVMFKLSYGLFVLTAKDSDRDTGCIINTVLQLTSTPLRISVTVNKANFTHDVIQKTGEFAVSVLTESVKFDVFERFGFQSGKNVDKFSGYEGVARTESGLMYLTGPSNGMMSARAIETVDCGTHTIFVADVTQAKVLSDDASVTYKYYFDNIKPKRGAQKDEKKKMVCRICGYVYDGESLPDSFICPICKHPAEDFELV